MKQFRGAVGKAMGALLDGAWLGGAWFGGARFGANGFSERDRKSTSRERLRRRLQMESLENRRVLAALPFGATEQDLGEFMLGSVAVTPVFLESDGSIDTSTEDWTDEHINEVLSNISEGLDWWVDTLATKSAIHELSFTVDTSYAEIPAETAYEPISRRSNDYTLYVGEFLANVGFSTGNLELDVRSFNHAQREKLGTDWSFTIFVVPSQNDADGQFAPGSSFSRAFAFAGGLFMIIPSTRPASTFTHETGHIFWARDEYPGGGSYFSRRGYYNTQNVNAADNPNPGFVQQPSIMAAGTLLDIAYANHVSPDSTLAMIGWQDSDGDGIFDLADVPHRLTGTGYFDVASGEYRFSGDATVQTLPNLNSSGLQNDITINRIREIEYRFDDGPWQVFSTPDVAQVTLDMSIPVPSEATEISIRARDSSTTVESNVFVGRLGRADSTLVPGINGFIWVDENRNGLRDVGEFGRDQWLVELIDEMGDPLVLDGRVEPDDFADGVLTNGFNPDLTITAVGGDADGRVAVFADTAASTGSKTFRGFSKGSQTFMSTWNSTSRRLQFDFATPTSRAAVDIIGATNGALGRLTAYNASGEIVGRATTAALESGATERLVVERGESDIAYVIIGGHANSNVKLDAFAYGPEAATLTDSLGRYQLPGLPTGTYEVRVTAPEGFFPLASSGGAQSVSVTANQAATDVDFGFEFSTSPWQNPVDPNDVNNDTLVSPIDVLLIINEINANGSRDLQGSGLITPPFIDVTGDSVLSPLDVLRVINAINAGA